MQYDRKTLSALAVLRMYAKHPNAARPVANAIEALDKAGVFAALDEQTDTPAALLLLAESAQGSVSRELAGHPDTVPVGEPLYGNAAQKVAARLRENQCPTCNATHFKDADALQFHIDAAH